MRGAARRRWAAWAGLAFVILSAVIAAIAPPWPAAGSPASALTAYYTAHRGPFLVGNYLASLAAIPSLLQIGALTSLVRQREGDEGAWWIASLAGSLLAHASGLVVLALYQATAFVATGDGGAAALALSEAANVGFGFFLIALAGAALTLGIALAQTRVVAPWIGRAALPGALLAFVASLGAIWPLGIFAAGGLVTIAAFSYFIVWVAGVSLALFRPEPA
jgi:hypothetical protein